MPASDLIIEKPHFGAKHQPTVKQSAALGRLFSTVCSSTDTQSLTPEEIASAVFPDSPNSVAFCYSHSFVEAQYEPYTDINIT